MLAIVPLLLAFVALGIAAELAFAWATARLLTTKPVAAPGPRARAILTRLLIGLGRAFAFALGSIGGFLLFTWPPNLRQVVLGYLGAILALRLALAVGRSLFAPDQAWYRVVPMSDPAASLWHRGLQFSSAGSPSAMSPSCSSTAWG